MIPQPKWRDGNVLDEYRFELKIPLDIHQYHGFKQCLYQIGLYPRRVYESRIISSIYLDTAEYVDYDDNISGIGQRRKTRIRWYNDNISDLVLERKIKANKASRKELYPLNNPNLIIPTSPSLLRELLAENRDIPVRILSERLVPSLEVQYKREYFMLDNDLRMTMDVDQKFKRLSPSIQSNYSRSPVFSVVEFKFPATSRLKMQRVLQGIPFRVFRHSKYVIGTEVVA